MTQLAQSVRLRDTSRWPVKPHQIAALRNRLGKTQVEFARLLSADPSAVSRWESGRSRPRRIYVVMITRMMKDGINGQK